MYYVSVVIDFFSLFYINTRNDSTRIFPLIDALNADDREAVRKGFNSIFWDKNVAQEFQVALDTAPMEREFCANDMVC